MFKKKVKPLPVDSKEKVEELEIEDEEDEEIIDDEEEEPKKVVKKVSKKSQYVAGDIIPVQQVVGYQVIKSISEDGVPSVVSTDKLSEAEILSFMYQED